MPCSTKELIETSGIIACPRRSDWTLGFAFGMGGLGSAALGRLADQTSTNFVFLVCSFLPLIGLLTAFLPDLARKSGITLETFD
jgi:hypothetical protein